MDIDVFLHIFTLHVSHVIIEDICFFISLPALRVKKNKHVFEAASNEEYKPNSI